MLRFRIRPRPRKLSSIEFPGSGPEGRIKRMRKVVTGLIRHERLELPLGQADEARGYAERLIQIAIKNGDRDSQTMELVDYWLLDKDLIHKLFKVLVPRYQQYNGSYSSLWQLPSRYPGPGGLMSCLELKGNPWPPIKPNQRNTKYLLTNVLLAAAREDHYMQKDKSELKSSEGERTPVCEESDHGIDANTVTVSKLETKSESDTVNTDREICENNMTCDHICVIC